LFSQEGAEPFLVVNPLHLNVPNTSGQEVVKVSSNAVWNLFEDVEWLIAIKTNDTTATISYNENLAAERSAQIIVSSPYLSPDTIKVIQGSNNAQLTVTPGLINLNYMIGSSGYFEISSNISWITSSNQTWLETSPASGTNNGTISVTAKSANTGTDSRNAEVTITGGGLTRIVTVTQVGTSANPCEPVFTEYFDNFSNWNPASNNGLNCSWTSVNGYAKIASMGNNPSGWIEAVYEKNLPQSIPSGTDFVLKAFIKVMDDDPSGSVSGVGVNLVDSDGNMVCRINFNDSQAASGYGGLQYSAGDDMVYTNDPNGFSTNNPTLNGLLELRRVGTTWTAFLDGQQLGSPKVFDVQRTATRVQITNSRYQNYGYRDGEID
jgi:hypothetical protein